MTNKPNFHDVLDAQNRIKDVIAQTPFLTSPKLNEITGANIWVKAENMQRRGSFKIRGAANAIFKRKDEAIEKGIIAYSSGNHAQGVALAARLIGAHATIIVPDDAPKAKLQGATDEGADILFYNRRTQDREQLGRDFQEKTGAILIPPFDHEDVITGQGTIGLEIIDFAKSKNIVFDKVFVQAAGGGLASGIGLVLEELSPKTELIIGEPITHNDLFRSMKSGQLESNSPDVPNSVQDALLAPRPGKITFPILQRIGAKVFEVTDDEALKAVAFAFANLKTVIEPGGACSLGLLLSGKIDVRGQNICVVASGGNIDATTFIKALETN